MRSHLTLWLLSVTMISGFSQNRLALSLQTESTVTGYEYGLTSLYQTRKQAGVGVFYQANLRSLWVENRYKSYFGMHFQVPFITRQELGLFGTCRAGLVNEKFIVVVPGLETQVTITSAVALNLGMSMRMSYPAISTKVIFKVLPYDKKPH